RAAVTNAEYKAWLDQQPPGKRRAPWMSGDLPKGQEEQPVKNVRIEDARSFAEARGQRLPTPAERAVLRRLALGAAEKEGEVEGASYVEWCRRCASYADHLIPCPNCSDGLDGHKAEQVRKKYGDCGYMVTAWEDKTIQVSLADDMKSATIAVDVKLFHTDKFAVEQAPWTLAPDGQWRVSTPPTGWIKPLWVPWWQDPRYLDPQRPAPGVR